MIVTAADLHPDWMKTGALRPAFYAADYIGFIYDLGDGTGRYAAPPELGADFNETRGWNGKLLTLEECDRVNAEKPKWGDRVRLDGDGNPVASQIVERYMPDWYDFRGVLKEEVTEAIKRLEERERATKKDGNRG